MQEPGYYENGNFGIRIETICVMKYVETRHSFNNKKFLGFDTVTMVPIATNLVNIAMMSDDELEWLNKYHETVRETLLPLMKEYFPESADYLIRETAALKRS